MANDAHSWPLVVLMLAAISTIVVGASLLANLVQWMFG
jgi:hypothetical protein